MALWQRCLAAMDPAEEDARAHLALAAVGQELLLSLGRPVAAVAEAVGIQDPYHFSRLFRRRTGLPPSAWRRRYGGGG